MWTFIDGSTLPIGTMYCIGRNYAAHAREMNAPVPEDPIVFLKPPAAYAEDGSTVALPSFSQNVHHEVELVVVIGADGENVSAHDAPSLIAGYGIGLDLTARDVQQGAKQRGEPWAVAKGWKHSAPVSRIVPRGTLHTGPLAFTLSVNNEARQFGSTSHMERSVNELISYVSTVFTLRRGDCIFTGTPEGVAQLHAGDTAIATLENLVTLTVHFA